MSGEELWTQLSSLSATDIVSGLKEHAHSAYQEIFNAGHGSAKGDLEEKVRKAEKGQQTAEKEADSLKAQIMELEEKQPDVASIRQQYEDQITELKAKQKQELEAKDEGIRKERRTSTRAELIASLVSHHNVDPDYAEVLVQKSDVADRITFDEQNGVRILQAGKDIPIAPSDNKSAVELFAEELNGSIEPKWKMSGGDSGSGTNRGAGPAGGSGSWDKYRERVKEERAARTHRPKDTAADRLGMLRD